MAFGKDKKSNRKFGGVVLVKAVKDVPRNIGREATEEQKSLIKASPLIKKGEKSRLKMKDAYPLFEKGFVEMIDPTTKDDITKEKIEEAKKELK